MRRKDHTFCDAGAPTATNDHATAIAARQLPLRDRSAIGVQARHAVAVQPVRGREGWPRIVSCADERARAVADVTAEGVQVTVFGDVAVRSLRRGDVHTICLFGHLHAANADAMQLELQRVAASDAKSIVVDLCDLESIDLVGARLLLRAHARSRADEKRPTLVRPTAAVQRTLEQSDVVGFPPFSN